LNQPKFNDANLKVQSSTVPWRGENSYAMEIDGTGNYVPSAVNYYPPENICT